MKLCDSQPSSSTDTMTSTDTIENSKTVPTSDEAIIQAVHDAYSANARTGADLSCTYLQVYCPV